MTRNSYSGTKDLPSIEQSLYGYCYQQKIYHIQH